MNTIVKKWFRDKEYGFLENGSARDIMVKKSDLINCQYLKVGATVEFECHCDKQGLIAKNVKLKRDNKQNSHIKSDRNSHYSKIGVMT